MKEVTEHFSLERAGNVWTVRFQPVDFMIFQRLEVTEALFELLEEVESKRVKILRVDYPPGGMSPAVVDRFWHDAREAPLVSGARHEPPLPAVIRNVSAAVPRLLRQLRRMTTFSISSFQGQVDLDLFGVLLASHYRICTEDTALVNRVFDRDAAPGSAVLWLLTRYLGAAAANHILLEGKSLTAQEALELRLVDRVVSPADLESECETIAQRFAATPGSSLASFVRATNHLDEDLETYLKEVGSGFGE